MLSAPRPRRLAACVFALALAGLSPAQGEDDLAARVETLRGRPDHDAHTQGALAQAQRALARATARRKTTDAAGSVRAERIARAALALAERRHAQQQTRRDLAATERRVATLREAIERESAALTVARQRERALRDAFEAALTATGDDASP